QLLESSFSDFIKAAWHVIEPATPLAWGRGLDAVCEHLQAVTDGLIRNLIITVPPGCTKSITVCVMWPSWVWTKFPWLRWLFASNAADLATRDSVACRRLIESDWYQSRWGHKYQLTGDQNAKTWYENDQRGHRACTTSGSTVTGKKGDLLIVDDGNDARKVE